MQDGRTSWPDKRRLYDDLVLADALPLLARQCGYDADAIEFEKFANHLAIGTELRTLDA